MKFKAKIEEPRSFLGVLQICRSIQRDCIVRLQASRTRFFTSIDILDGVQVWMGCRTEFLFSDFRCDSHYKEQSITCEIMELQQFMHILKQADVRRHNAGVSQTVIRLARNGNRPIFKLTMQGTGQGLPDLSYDVPIRILSDREVQSMQAPPLEDEHVQVVIPSLPELTVFIDQLKLSACESVTFVAQAYSSVVSVEGGRSSLPAGQKRGRDSTVTSSSGRPSTGLPQATLQVLADNFLASFSLKYDAVERIPRQREERRDKGAVNARADDDDCPRSHTGAVEVDESGMPQQEEEEEERQEEEEDDDGEETRAAAVTVELKKFARFFSAVREISPTRLSMYLVDQQALVLSVQALGNTTMVAYIPAKKD